MVDEGLYSLYFHIPFCLSKCPYCHFYSIQYREDLLDRFLHALEKEITLYKDKIASKKITSIYFGGGTPLLLGSKNLSRLLSHFTLENDCEITCEANPEMCTLNLLQDLKKETAINRLSFGVQSFHDNELKALGRRHSSKEAKKVLCMAYEAGFENVSLDLIYEIPHQTLQSFRETLNQATALPVSHISLYNLTIEPHTPFWRQKRSLEKLVPSNDTGAEMYQMMQEVLFEHGFEQYEISAFCREGKYSRHNVGYWTSRSFFGFGPSAFSFYKNERFKNVSNLLHYERALEKDQSPIDFSTLCDDIEQREEFFILHLRLLEGVEKERYGPFSEEFENKIAHCIDLGLLEENECRIRLSKRGVLFYDEVASLLV